MGSTAGAAGTVTASASALLLLGLVFAAHSFGWHALARNAVLWRALSSALSSARVSAQQRRDAGAPLTAAASSQVLGTSFVASLAGLAICAVGVVLKVSRPLIHFADSLRRATDSLRRAGVLLEPASRAENCVRNRGMPPPGNKWQVTSRIREVFFDGFIVGVGCAIVLISTVGMIAAHKEAKLGLRIYVSLLGLAVGAMGILAFFLSRDGHAAITDWLATEWQVSLAHICSSALAPGGLVGLAGIGLGGKQPAPGQPAPGQPALGLADASAQPGVQGGSADWPCDEESVRVPRQPSRPGALLCGAGLCPDTAFPQPGRCAPRRASLWARPSSARRTTSS